MKTKPTYFGAAFFALWRASSACSNAESRLGGFEATEACGDGDDVRPLLWHGLGFRGGRS